MRSTSFVALLSLFYFGIVVVPSHSVRLEPRRLQFISVGATTCPLSNALHQFRYNGTSRLYEYCNPTTAKCSPVLMNHTFGRLLFDPSVVRGGGDGKISAFRSCSCSRLVFSGSTQFCPAEFDGCLVQSSKNGSVLRCFHANPSADSLEFMWVVAVFLLLGLTIVFSCSNNGVKARKYVRMQMRALICGKQAADDCLRNELEKILRNDPAKAAYMYQLAVTYARDEEAMMQNQTHPNSFARGVFCLWHARAHRRNSEAARMDYDPILDGACNVLMLKTKTVSMMKPDVSNASLLSDRFRCESAIEAGDNCKGRPMTTGDMFRRPSLAESVREDENDEEMNSGGRCAICLAHLAVGDVVGDIPCGHLFHKACLKDWLTRQNHCPMCRQTGIADINQRRPLDVPDQKR